MTNENWLMTNDIFIGHWSILIGHFDYGAGVAGFNVTTGAGSREPTGPTNSSFVPSS
jgi:hypothetical protein